MDSVARLPAGERADLFNETGARRGLSPSIPEKDFWVCWMLKRLFTLPGENPSLVFKGGTSLSKVYGVIQRFSEDVDLSFDRKHLGYAGDRDPSNAPSRKKAEKLIEGLVADVERHIAEIFLPLLRETVAAQLGQRGETWDLFTDADPQTVIFRYPPSLSAGTYGDTAYINPVVRLELGACGDSWPAEQRQIRPYSAEEFPNIFRDPAVELTVLSAERTFWEKATLLHMECHREAGKRTGERLSRHYYDLALLADSEHGERALRDLGLLENVAKHKKVFFPAAWARYEEARPGSLRLVPRDDQRKDLNADYAKMQPMIFDTPPDFADVLGRIATLEQRINAPA